MAPRWEQTDTGGHERRPEVVAVAVVAVEVSLGFPAGHAVPIMARVLLRDQTVPELVPIIKMAMVPLRIRPKVPLLRDGQTATSKAADGARPIAHVDVDHPPAFIGRLAVAADPARE